MRSGNLCDFFNFFGFGSGMQKEARGVYRLNLIFYFNIFKGGATRSIIKGSFSRKPRIAIGVCGGGGIFCCVIGGGGRDVCMKMGIY